MSKLCRWCGSSEHTQFYCYKKPRKQIAKISKKRLENPKPIKQKKPIKKIGKRAIKWRETSKEWKKLNPPNEYGYWHCKVGGALLSDKQDEVLRLNLCHDKSRARHPSLAFELSNIFPGCPRHNKEQGSKDLDEYLGGPHSFSCGNF